VVLWLGWRARRRVVKEGGGSAAAAAPDAERSPAPH
jgi:hypothetical protein